MLHETIPQSAKFLYYSDYDVQACHIFLTLKYGCKATAWASESQVCPRLEWRGPTRQRFFDHHHKYFQQSEDKWPQRQSQIERKILKTTTTVDQGILTWAESLDLLKDEPVLATEMRNMAKGLGVSVNPLLAEWTD